MAAHAAPVSRQDTAVAVIQLRITVPRTDRERYGYPTGYDAGNIVREQLQRWEAGALPIEDLLAMADGITWQVTK